MPSFLLEVGTEELPAGAVAPAAEQLRTALLARLDAERLAVPDAAPARTLATPRRLTVIVPELRARQTDAAVEARGPQVRAAFGADGAPTAAALGFARKQGVDVADLAVAGDYVVARRTERGQPAGDVLAWIVPDLLRALTFPKFMRWGAGNYRFGRPLRRLVALLDGEIVPVEVEGVVSGRATAGHRSGGSKPVVVPKPAAYADALRSAQVEPDPAARRDRIVAEANRLAGGIGGRAVLDDALVYENVYLTEWVTGVLGTFDPGYLELPRPVLVTAMQKHQRFFPVEAEDGDLLPRFVAIRNGDAAHLDTVRAGYEKVLASRFNDAKFFFDHDRQSRLEDKCARTGRIVFQERLGSLADKTRRVEFVLRETGLPRWTGDPAAVARAAALMKADLASEIVAELPALQGVMGREFALLDGEPAAVADALREQYLPRAAGDRLPDTRVGTALALADRVDTLVGYVEFLGEEPKGSSDPFGLKRAASAVVELLARDRTLPGLNELLRAAAGAYRAQGVEPAAKPGDLRGLLLARLRGLLEERGVRYDLVNAVLAAPWDDVASVIARADALSVFLFTAAEVGVAGAATRVRNLLRGADAGDTAAGAAPNFGLLVEPEERTLAAFLDTVEPRVEVDLAVGEITDALDTLAALTEPVNRFFDAVLVMTDDPPLRRARLALLARADRLYLKLADFSKLVLE
jgi:glycyl-tRNA synthetase beta chain